MASDAEQETMSADQRSVLARIIEEHGEHLRRFVLTHLSDRAEREDVTQEVYLRLAGYGRIDQLENPRAFLFRIAHNLIRDRARRAAFRGIAKHDSIDNFVLPDPTPGQDRALQDRQELARLRDAIATMEEPARTAFVLSRFEELGYREIAERLGVSVSTVERLISKALDQLRAAVRNDSAGASLNQEEGK